MPSEKPSREQTLQHMKEIVILYGQYDRLNKQADKLGPEDTENLNIMRMHIERIGKDINMTATLNNITRLDNIMLEPHEKGMMMMAQWARDPQAHADELNKVIPTEYISLEIGSQALKGDLKAFSAKAQEMSKPDLPAKRGQEQGAQKPEGFKKFSASDMVKDLKTQMKGKIKEAGQQITEKMNQFRNR